MNALMKPKMNSETNPEYRLPESGGHIGVGENDRFLEQRRDGAFHPPKGKTPSPPPTEQSSPSSQSTEGNDHKQGEQETS